MDREHRGPCVHGAGEEGPPAPWPWRSTRNRSCENVLLERGAPIYATRNNTSSEHLAPGTHDRWAGELSYDPEGAKALLAEAGYPNGFKTDFFNVSGARPLQQEIGTAVIPMLRAVGIDINEQRVEWSSIAGKSSKGEVAAPLMIGGSREIWPITFRAGPPLGYGGFGWSHQRVLDDRDVHAVLAIS